MLKFPNSPKKLINNQVNKKTDFGDKLENINKKITSNKTNHVEGEKKLNELSQKVKLLCYAVRNIRACAIFKQMGPSCKKGIHVDSTSNTFPRIYEDYYLNFNCFDLP